MATRPASSVPWALPASVATVMARSLALALRGRFGLVSVAVPPASLVAAGAVSLA